MVVNKGSIIQVLKDRYRRNDDSKEVLQRSLGVTNYIDKLCEANLRFPEDEIVFEVTGRDLEYAVDVIHRAPLSERYDIVQLNTDQEVKTLFRARLKTIDVF